MKKILTIIFIALGAAAVMPQTKITLEECYSKARANYPLIKQREYIVRSREFNVSNIWKGYFPQITINAQATYQSDVTSLPISIPGIKIEPLALDQYKVIADVSQVLYDGGIMSAKAEIQKSGAEVEDQKIEAALIQVKERINQIYFGILLLDRQIEQTGLIKIDLNSSLDKLNAALANGTASRQNVDVLKAESLKTDQREIELKSSRKAYTDMLGLLINMNLGEYPLLEQPPSQNFVESTAINRPELNIYNLQEKMIDDQGSITLSKILPKAGLFFQGGYGKPTLNMLKNSFNWFYITGARLTWTLSNLYTYGHENEINELNRKSIEAQKETFLLNTNLSIVQEKNEIEKLTKLIKVDMEIIEIRRSVKESAQAQLENGVITSNDFLRELNAEDQAKQNLAIHTIQLMLANQNYKLTVGN